MSESDLRKPDFNKVHEYLFREYGGKEQFARVFDARIAEMNNRWEQDTERIGRILRSHLYVEHYLTECLQAKNPQLGSLADARLSFLQKVDLLGNKNKVLALLVPGMRLLNAIRNRLSHTLCSDVTKDDANGFLALEQFGALRKALHPDASSDPIDILEDFARLAASWLDLQGSGEADVWARAMKLTGR